MKETESIKIPIDESIDVNLLFGNLDCNLQRVREATRTEIFQREDSLILKGGDIKMAEEIIYELVAALKKEHALEEQKAAYIISLKRDGVSYDEENIDSDVICFTTRGKPIKAKTLGQKESSRPRRFPRSTASCTGCPSNDSTKPTV